MQLQSEDSILKSTAAFCKTIQSGTLPTSLMALSTAGMHDPLQVSLIFPLGWHTECTCKRELRFFGMASIAACLSSALRRAAVDSTS